MRRKLRIVHVTKVSETVADRRHGKAVRSFPVQIDKAAIVSRSRQYGAQFHGFFKRVNKCLSILPISRRNILALWQFAFF
jgi:hypothetical protein